MCSSLWGLPYKSFILHFANPENNSIWLIWIRKLAEKMFPYQDMMRFATVGTYTMKKKLDLPYLNKETDNWKKCSKGLLIYSDQFISHPNYMESNIQCWGKIDNRKYGFKVMGDSVWIFLKIWKNLFLEQLISVQLKP